MAPSSPLSAAPDQINSAPAFDRRRFWLVVGAGGGLLTLAGGLLSLRFGGAIFFDMLASLQGCF